MDGSSSNDDVFVGGKDARTYANAVVHQMVAGHEVVTLRARGRAIPRAVDAAELVRRDLRPGSTVGRITIDSEKRVTDKGRPIFVSSIAIPLHDAAASAPAEDTAAHAEAEASAEPEA